MTNSSASPKNAPEAKTYPARYALIVMLALGLAAVAGSSLFYRMIQRRPLALWGTANAELIARSPVAEALLLAQPGTKVGGEAIETLRIDDQRWVVVERREVSRAPGFSHLRSALMNDHGFLWDAPDEPTAPVWQYGISFTDGNSEATLLFAPNVHRVRLLASPPAQPQATLDIMPGIERFMLEQFGGKK